MENLWGFCAFIFCVVTLERKYPMPPWGYNLTYHYRLHSVNALLVASLDTYL